MNIHPTAIIADSATIGENLTAGPYSIVEEGVTIGSDCELAASAQVRRGSEIGDGCYIGSGAIVGADPQFIGFDSSLDTGVKIGDKNTLREYVTIHRSVYEGQHTVMGSGNYLMCGSHLGHDSILGDGNTLANNVLFAGHVEAGNFCFFGGASAFHQFVRIGDYVMAQGMAGMSNDVPPYTICSNINGIAGLNMVGMRRGGFSPAERKNLKEAFSLVYQKKLTVKEAISRSKQMSWEKPAQDFFAFIEGKSKKGVCFGLRSG